MWLMRYEGFIMNKVSRGCGSQYMDCFKRKIVADSRADGMNASMLAKKNGVGSNRI